MRVLQLVPRLPYPPDDGGKIGILGITTALLDLGHGLRLGGFDEEGQAARFGDAVGRRLDAWFVEGIPARRVRWSQLKVAAGIGTYLRDKYWSPSFARAVVRHVDEFQPDFVHLDHSHMGSYGLLLKRRRPGLRVFLRAHNVESVIWRRRADLASDAFRRGIFARQAGLSERAEVEMFGRFDGVVSISAVDTALIRTQCPSARVYEMPAGCALNEPAPLRPDVLVDPRLCFVGSLDYTANRDGLAWFVAEVWPAIRARFPAASLTVAGRSATPVRFLEDAPGVRYVGFVASVSDVTDAADLAVVPLRIGGGIRVKILDLLSRGVPTISTTVGAEGTRVEHEGTNVVALADDAAQFVAQIARLAADPPARFAMAREGRRLIAAQYDWGPLVSAYCDWAASLPVRSD